MDCVVVVIWVLVAILLFLQIMLVKNEITCKQRLKIVNAICRYGDKDVVSYDDMESYDDTLWRLWDRGYTRILPKEKYALIRHLVED